MNVDADKFFQKHAPEVPVRVFLSRRNLLTLLAKLDRAACGEVTARTIIKCDTEHPTHAQSHSTIWVVAVEDDDYYIDREPGETYEEL